MIDVMRQYIHDLLESLGIKFSFIEHAPIITMEEGMEIAAKLGVVPCKNLFLVNRQKEYLLLLVAGDKKVSTKEIARQIGSSHLSFASDEELQELLHVVSGGVSILGLAYDKANKVKPVIDSAILHTEFIGCHPCYNNCSLKLRTKDILDVFLPAVNHADYKIVQA